MTSVLSETIDAVRVLTLNRPDAGNRVSTQMAETLIDRLEEADGDPQIRAIVLTGAGKQFCMGGDAGAAGRTVDDHLAFTAAFRALTQSIFDLGTPVIAAAAGNAHAGGFSLLACCDLAILSADATLALPELHDGLFPVLAMAIVQPVLPRKVFFDLVYGGGELHAQDALRLDLVNELHPADQVVARAVERGRALSHVNASALRIGRQTYGAMSRMDVPGALEHARYVLPTLIAAAKA